MNKVTVIDYGLGNLYSVAKALERCGAEVEISEAAGAIDAADRLILPGVGAFADGMRGLNERGLIEPIRRYARSGRPMMGICLGMQMLMECSHEFGRHEGLGVIPGEVVNIPAQNKMGHPHKIPHIGWSVLQPAGGRVGWQGSVLEKVRHGEALYFVHSFMAAPSDPRNRLADCEYGGQAVSAAIERDAIVGCQFHPEKSGTVGLRILTEFISR